MVMITVQSLRALQACEEQVELFARTFPGGAGWSHENIVQALQVGLDVTWLARAMYCTGVSLSGACLSGADIEIDSLREATAPPPQDPHAA